jgi:hypothetical protein
MVTVFESTDPKLAALVQMVLRDAGIKFHVDNGNSAFASSPAIMITILTSEEDAAKAKRAIEDGLRQMGEMQNPNQGQ